MIVRKQTIIGRMRVAAIWVWNSFTTGNIANYLKKKNIRKFPYNKSSDSLTSATIIQFVASDDLLGGFFIITLHFWILKII